MTAIRRRPSGDIWQGLYEPLLTDAPPQGATLLRQNVKHVLTHRILLADFYLLEVQEPPTLPEEYIWVDESDLDRYAFPRLIQILFEAL